MKARAKDNIDDKEIFVSDDRFCGLKQKSTQDGRRQPELPVFSDIDFGPQAPFEHPFAN